MLFFPLELAWKKKKRGKGDTLRKSLKKGGKGILFVNH
jgi:uncharacterized membrane protein (UPF0127 family)